ncbi:hypothetical protein QQG55_37970 [Brugia pahangi]|uniref:Ovule protein n=1 Tax=Brugia pahangi TaxID=6280 RepID=A0A0N4TL36_BRUPA|nr:unnamed protein product [Brugia pahangi]
MSYDGRSGACSTCTTQQYIHESAIGNIFSLLLSLMFNRQGQKMQFTKTNPTKIFKLKIQTRTTTIILHFP